MKLVRRVLARLIAGQETPRPAIRERRDDTRERQRDDLLAAFLGGAEVVRLDDYRNGRGGARSWTS